jgi:hypothetical protein
MAFLHCMFCIVLDKCFPLLTYSSHTIALEQLLPVLFSTPESDIGPTSLFKFVGGFGLPSRTVGFLFACQGFLQMIAQLLVFPSINESLGSLATARIAINSYPFLYVLIPYMGLVHDSIRYFFVFLVLIWKVTAQSLSYAALSIMLANSAPNKGVLGTLNGFAMCAASGARALSPPLVGWIHAAGLSNGYSGLSWWSCAIIATVGILVGSVMTERKDEVCLTLQYTDTDEDST